MKINDEPDHNDWEPEWTPLELPPGAKVIVGEGIYKIGVFRAVTCPDSSIVFIRPSEMDAAFEDLRTWAIPIHPKMLNQ